MTNSRFSHLWYSMLSGILLALATPLVGLSSLVFVALIPFFLNSFALKNTRQLALSFLFMITPYAIAICESLFRLSGTWWVNEGETFPVIHALEYTTFIFLVVFFGAAFYVVPMLIVSKIRKPLVPLPIILALLFATAEFVRSSIFVLGYSWGALGYLLVDAVPIKHAASLVGVYGLTFIVVLGNAWGAMLIARYYTTKGNIMTRLREVFFKEQHLYETIALTSLFVAIFLFGAYRESRMADTGLHLRVAVISSNISTAESINEHSYRIYRSLFALAVEKKPDLILTPENVFPYFTVDEEGSMLAQYQPVYMQNAQALYADFLSLTREYPKTTFAIATHSIKNGLLYNSILLYRDGKVASVYHKRRPVPFTEYAPLGLPFPIFEIFAKGEDKQDFHMDAIPLAGFICSEVDITPLSADGAKLILSPSNDSVFVSDGILSLHHRIARMRALENGAYLLRSTKGGISSIIDPYGNTLAAMSEATGILIADIPERAGGNIQRITL